MYIPGASNTDIGLVVAATITAVSALWSNRQNRKLRQGQSTGNGKSLGQTVYDAAQLAVSTEARLSRVEQGQEEAKVIAAKAAARAQQASEEASKAHVAAAEAAAIAALSHTAIEDHLTKHHPVARTPRTVSRKKPT